MMTDIDPVVRQQVTDLVLQYAAGIDGRDWKLFRACFTDDCVADYGDDVGRWESADAITQFMEQVHADCGHTMHQIGNQVVRADGDGYAARSYVDAVVLRADNRKGLQMLGYYDDEFVSTTDGWKIARRRFTSVLTTRIASRSET